MASPFPNGGALSTIDLLAELDLPAGTSYGTNNADLISMADKTAGAACSTNDLYGKYARTRFNSKTTTLTIGSNVVDANTAYYGCLAGYYGSVGNGSFSFSNGEAGSLYQLTVAKGAFAVGSLAVYVPDYTKFKYEQQIKGVRLTFYDASTSSTKVIETNSGSAIDSVTDLATVGTGQGHTTWFESRVGKTVNVTIVSL